LFVFFSCHFEGKREIFFKERLGLMRCLTSFDMTKDKLTFYFEAAGLSVLGKRLPAAR
jgi:hypothetical protein